MSDERILVIDDARQMRHFITDILGSAGYDLLSAADGREGVTLALDLDPDLIICDYQMPDRNGLDVLRTLREAERPFPFILITAEGSEELAVAALRLGVNDYLIKPFDPDELLDAVERVLREHWTRQITQRVPVHLLETNVTLERRLRELDMLVKTGKRVTSQLDSRAVMNQVVQAAVALAGAEDGDLLLVDHASGELYLYASTRQDDRLNGSYRVRVSDSLAGQVVRSGEPLMLTDQESIKTHVICCELAYVPLRVKDRVIGVLGVFNRTTTTGFDAPMLRALTVMADFSAIALDNARLYSAVEQERSMFNTILRDTEDAILIVDQAGRLTFANPAACNHFGLDFPAARGGAAAQIIRHEGLHDLLDQETAPGHSHLAELVIDENDCILNAHLTHVRGVGHVVVMQDITHLKELDRIKSDFVTTVSHDLRSPLTAILGYVDLVKRGGPLNEAQTEFVERIVFSVHSITGLITDLLELGKIEAGFDHTLVPVNLGPVIQHALEGLRHQWEAKRLRLDIQLPDELPRVLGNSLRLRQLVGNLLENAVKYTLEEGQVRIAADTQNGFLILRVADSGIGIPQKDQPYIFDKFYRSDEAVDGFVGTGLGLSIVKSIVEQHDGRIWVESQVGRGTVFTVMLPTHEAQIARLQAGDV